jgi:hypothetical protein
MAHRRSRRPRHRQGESRIAFLRLALPAIRLDYSEIELIVVADRRDTAGRVGP